MSKQTVQTVLFAQLPLNKKFRYPLPENGNIYIKTSEDGAHRDGAYYPMNPGVLVEPVIELEIWKEVVPPEQGADATYIQAKIVER